MSTSKLFLVVIVLFTAISACKSKYHWQTREASNETNYLVFPETKWCGKGNNAMFYEDLGKHSQTDKCCRTHDHCPTFIPAFKRRYGMLNLHTMQMSHCSCETHLFDCLWKLGNPVSTAVGRLYFNVLRTPCFKLVEVRTCTKWSFNWWNLKYFCVKYGTVLKAKKFWLQNYLRKFPVNVRQNSTKGPSTTTHTQQQATEATPTVSK